MLDWAGLQVVSITFEGVHESAEAAARLSWPSRPGAPLDPDKVRDSLRSLYATGLYETIEVPGVRAGNDVTIIFSGPRASLWAESTWRA